MPSQVCFPSHLTTAIAPGQEGMAPAFIEALGMLHEGADEALIILYDEPIADFYPIAPFKLNAAFPCVLALRIVTPVTISCYPSTLTKAEQWYQILERHFHLAMHVGGIALDEFTQIQPRSIAVRRFNQYLQDYFTQQRERYINYGK